MNMNNFAVFIPSFGRSDNIKTLDTLNRFGYTGKTYIVCSDDDSTLSDYKHTFQESCIVFNKDEYADTFDIYDNFDDQRTVIFAKIAIGSFKPVS